MSQKKRHSLVEALLGTAIGVATATVCNYFVLPLFGFRVTLTQSVWIALIFTVLSVVRGYLVRRWFNSLHDRGILK